MVDRPFAAVAARARRQHGVVTRRQLEALGHNRMSIQRLLDRGLLDRLHRGVYRAAGVPESWHQRQLAAVLACGPGAVASHRAAAHLWGLLEEPPARPEVTVPRGRTPKPSGVIVHRSTALDHLDVVTHRRIPATTPMRALLDLGAVLGPDELEDCLDRGLQARRYSVATVEWAYNRLAAPGRHGTGVLRAVLDERALGEDPPDGLLEPRMARLLRDAGLAGWVFQHEVRDRAGRFVARVDFAWPALRLAVEVDGYEKRATRRAMQADYDRQHALEDLGWLVRRFTWIDVVRRPAPVAAAIARDLERLAARAG